MPCVYCHIMYEWRLTKGLENMYLYFHVFILLLLLKEIVLASVKDVTRCTRRFTAGYCEVRVKPVWTFVFQKQDCVMRMGCPSSPRVNRFSKYEHCQRHCKLLVDLYTQILLNDTVALRGFRGSLRRDVDGNIESDTADPKYPEVYEDAMDFPHYENDASESVEEVVLSNIDGEPEIHTFLDMLNNKNDFND